MLRYDIVLSRSAMVRSLGFCQRSPDFSHRRTFERFVEIPSTMLAKLQAVLDYSGCTESRRPLAELSNRITPGAPKPLPQSVDLTATYLPWVSLGDEPFSPEGWDGD